MPVGEDHRHLGTQIVTGARVLAARVAQTDHQHVDRGSLAQGPGWPPFAEQGLPLGGLGVARRFRGGLFAALGRGRGGGRLGLLLRGGLDPRGLAGDHGRFEIRLQLDAGRMVMSDTWSAAPMVSPEMSMSTDGGMSAGLALICRV